MEIKKHHTKTEQENSQYINNELDKQQKRICNPGKKKEEEEEEKNESQVQQSLFQTAILHKLCDFACSDFIDNNFKNVIDLKINQILNK